MKHGHGVIHKDDGEILHVEYDYDVIVKEETL